jgi:hypothetical protein
MKSIFILTFLMMASFASFSQKQQNIIALKGGTVIDVSNYGKSEKDIPNAVVIIENGKITAVGSDIKIPKNAKVIDVRGKYIVPGLIDCFATINNQAYANAFLYMGVTTVVASDNDDRRGKVDYTVSPAPAIYKMENFWGRNLKLKTGDDGFEETEVWNEDKINKEIDSLAKANVKVLLVHYGVESKQLKTIVSASKRNTMATIGELGLTSYEDAVTAGIQSFVHTSRYSADLLPDSVRKEYSTAPFGPPAIYYYEYIVNHQNLLNDPKVNRLANLFGSHDVGLIPTASMTVYPEMDFMKNPWLEPIASIINENDIEHEPLDKKTGKRKVPTPRRTKAAPKMHALDQTFAKNGVRFLSGSGTDAFGTIPGVSLHTELTMLSHSGLTNRQVLAAATHNFSLLLNWTSIGKIEPGREADVLVLNSNPLESVENSKDIKVLIVDGEIIDREKLLH